jgi:two-component system, NtrC family, sensor kinase
MRLTLKLTLGILFGVGVTLLVNVLLRVQREAELFESDIQKDHVILGRALAIDLVEEWRAGGASAAFALAARMNSERAGIDIGAVPLEELSPSVVGALQAGEVHQSIDGEGAEQRLVTFLPLARRAGVVAALRLEESLAPAHGYVATTLVRTAVSAVVGLLASTGLAFIFGFLLVGRPVRALVEKARRVGAGDLSGPLRGTRRDELGMLERELNAMCDRLEVARNELERATAQRIAAVQQLRHADRLSTVGLLSAGIAHELGTPLNIVSGRARLIAEQTEIPEATARNARVIEEQAQRMTAIVRQLLDFARARRPAKSDTDVGKLASDTAEMLSTLAGKRGVELAVEAAPPGTRACVDAGQVQQAMTNLVVNAVQASPRGARVAIRVHDETPPGDRPLTCISVVDEGGGMDDEQLQNVFTPFFTTKDVGEGTGLGLAVAWGLVQENGGHISVQSEKSRGSTFTIYLPKLEEKR